MYYEETIINNRLWFRNTPNGTWLVISPEELTARLIKAEKRIADLEYTYNP